MTNVDEIFKSAYKDSLNGMHLYCPANFIINSIWNVLMNVSVLKD
jgi:hypothetical protein